MISRAFELLVAPHRRPAHGGARAHRGARRHRGLLGLGRRLGRPRRRPGRNLAVAFVALWILAHIHPQLLMRLALPVYVVGPGAAGRRGALRRDAQRRAPLAQPRHHHHPALGDHEDRRAARCSRGTSTAARRACGCATSPSPRCCSRFPSASSCASPTSGTAMLIFASGFFVIFLAGLSWKILGRLAVAGRGEPAVPLVDAARLPAPARAHAARPDAGPAGRGLPHHPVHHRDRLRRHPRQGVAQRHAGAARLPARALHRLHPRGVRRGVRPGGQRGPGRAVPAHHRRAA